MRVLHLHGTFLGEGRVDEGAPSTLTFLGEGTC